MSALEELRNEKLGDEFFALLQRTIAAIGRTGLFPPSGGRGHWDSDAVRDTVAAFLASPQTPRRLTDLRTHCATDRALAARLQRTVHNFLADVGRRTPVGRLVLRFNEVLGQDTEFERDGLYWRIAGSVEKRSVVDIDRLVDVVSSVEVAAPTAWHKGDRQSPDIDAPSVRRLARAALEAAGGPVRPAELAQIAAKRLGLGMPPLSLDATAYDPAQPMFHSADFTGTDALTTIRAEEVFSRLNERERLSIGLADLSVEALGEVVGVSGSKAHLIRRRAVAILKDELREEEDGQAVADEVFEIARMWSETWMTSADPT